MSTDTIVASATPVDTSPKAAKPRKAAPIVASPDAGIRALAVQSLEEATRDAEHVGTLAKIRDGATVATPKDLAPLARCIDDALFAESMARAWSKVARSRSDLVVASSARFDRGYSVRTASGESVNASALATLCRAGAKVFRASVREAMTSLMSK
jgi:hypothetical protein